MPIAASLAKVRQTASARSGLGKPRLRICSFDSICILPEDVNLYFGLTSSASKASSLGIKTSLDSSQPLSLNQSSALRFEYVPAMLGASEEFTPTVGKPSSCSRSTTPPPTPIESTRISTGLSRGPSASYSALIAPVNCIRSRPRQVRMSRKTRPWRLARALDAEPNRATSMPHTTLASSSTSTSRCCADSTSSSGIAVSSSLAGKSPNTRTR